jgi:hypothetical protein
MLLVVLFVFSIMVILGVPGGNPDFPSDKPTVWVDDYEFFNAANLTGTKFNVSVNIFNVTDMWGFEMKLGYNVTLLHAIRVYPTAITENAAYWNPPKTPYTGGVLLGLRPRRKQHASVCARLRIRMDWRCGLLWKLYIFHGQRSNVYGRVPNH